jgi:TonB family protein
MRSARHAVPLLVMMLTALAAAAGERPALATVSMSESHAVDGGSWTSLLKRTAEPWTCGAANAGTKCVEHGVVVDNQSPQTLECTAAFDSQAGDAPKVSGQDVPALVLPRSAREIHGPIATTHTKIELARLDCRARPPYQRIKVDGNCKYEMFGSAFEEYYPAAAVNQALEGPVVVAFQLTARYGPATDISVAESSLVVSLDEAAKRFVKDQKFKTNCPGTRFDVRMRFTLRDRYLDAPTR